MKISKKIISRFLILCFIISFNITVAFGATEYTNETTSSVIIPPDNAVDGQFKAIIKGNTEVDANGKVKSTLPIRIKSVGKNLLPPFTEWQLPKGTNIISANKISYTANQDTILPQFFVSPKIPVIGGQTYTLSAAQFPCTVLVWLDKDGNFISENYNTPTAAAPLNAKYVKQHYYITSIGTYTIENPQLEYGNKATSFETNKESKLYVNETLRSLPNGVRDEVGYENGKYYLKKKINKYAITGSEIFYEVTDMGNTYRIATLHNLKDANLDCNTPKIIKNFPYIPNWGLDTRHIFMDFNLNVFENKSIIDSQSGSNAREKFINYLKGFELIYLLDKPKLYNLNIPPLVCFKNGTIFIENAVKDIGVYSEDIFIQNKEVPIKFMESVYKIDGNTRMSIDLNKVKVATDGLSFTIDGAKAGERYEYVYQYDSSLSTIPTIKYTVPTDMESQINNNTDMIKQLSDTVNTLLEENKALKQGRGTSSGVKTIDYEYDANGSLMRRIQQ